MILLTRQLLQIKQKQKHVNSKTQRVKYLELNDILKKKKLQQKFHLNGHIVGFHSQTQKLRIQHK